MRDGIGLFSVCCVWTIRLFSRNRLED